MRPFLILCALSALPVVSSPVAAQEASRPRHTLRVPLDDGAGRELNVYPIRAVVDAILAASGEPADAEPDAVAPPRPTAVGLVVDAVPPRQNTAQVLRDAIATFVEPPFADGEEVQALGRDHLAIVARPEQHAWVHRFLERQRTTAGTVGMIEVQVLSMPPQSFEALELVEEPTVLDATAAAALLKRVRGNDADPELRIDVLEAPRLATLSTQRAHISSISQTAYVKNFKVETVDGARIADPEVAVVQDGITLAGSFVVIDDGVLGLAWHVQVADLERPIPKAEVDLGLDAPFTIQLPNVAVAEFDAKVRLAKGELAVLPGPPLRGRRIVLLMGAHTEFGVPAGAHPIAPPVGRRRR